MHQLLREKASRGEAIDKAGGSDVSDHELLSGDRYLFTQECLISTWRMTYEVYRLPCSRNRVRSKL